MPSAPRRPDATVVELPADPCLDGDDRARLCERLVRAGRQAERLVLDCSRVRLFGAALLGVLVGVTRRLGARRGDVVLCGLDDSAREALRATGLDGLWPTFPTRREAVAAELDPAAVFVERRPLPGS